MMARGEDVLHGCGFLLSDGPAIVSIFREREAAYASPRMSGCCDAGARRDLPRCFFPALR